MSLGRSRRTCQSFILVQKSVGLSEVENSVTIISACMHPYSIHTGPSFSLKRQLFKIYSGRGRRVEERRRVPHDRPPVDRDPGGGSHVRRVPAVVRQVPVDDPAVDGDGLERGDRGRDRLDGRVLQGGREEMEKEKERERKVLSGQYTAERGKKMKEGDRSKYVQKPAATVTFMPVIP